MDHASGMADRRYAITGAKFQARAPVILWYIVDTGLQRLCF